MSTHQPPQAQPPTPQPPHPPVSALPTTAQRERLSALVDGEGGGAGLSQADELSAALADWRNDAQACQAWHSYQLIGDVLRSEDLARPARDDLAFMSRLRERLETEPLHLAPAPAVAAPPAPAAPAAPFAPAARPLASRRKLGAALAASCAVATVALLLARDAGTGAGADNAPALAAAGSALTDTAPGVAAGAAAATLAVNAEGVLRDPRLDEFLRLHHMARGGLAMGAPGGTLQRADLQMPGGVQR